MNTTILPICYDDDMDHIMIRDKCNVVGIEQMSVTYYQTADTNSSSDECQHLTITTEMACSSSEENIENKDGFYFNISIPDGEHWSINEGDELLEIVEDFKRRLYMTTNYNPKPEKEECKDNNQE